MTNLFTPLTVKDLTIKNRIVMPPMCQYSVEAKDGKPNDWHYIHYVSRAIGGTGLIIMEMTDVDPDGRITDYDLGLWSDDQIPSFARVIEACQKYGAKVGIQIAHAGRKAQDACVPVAPSRIPHSSNYKIPRTLKTDETRKIITQFKDAAKRAIKAGVDTIELHGAHGYLIHQFHSPLINNRNDEYGKELTRFGVEIIEAVKSVMPDHMPLIMRISAVEYVDDGYGIDYCIELCQKYQEAGVDIFHVTSGGEGPIGSGGPPGSTSGYQVHMAKAIRNFLSVPVIAVGLIDDYALAESIIEHKKADLIAVGRGMLRDPYWAIHAAKALNYEIAVPKQYSLAFY
jgi:NADPH2 dehydrogenase